VEKPDWEEEMRGLSPERSLTMKWPTSASLSQDDITDSDVVERWDANAEYWDGGYDEHGDRNRKYQSDPILFELLGPVKGLRILDAGSGNGYLCRLLTKRGAKMVGIELSGRFYEIARRYESGEPLGIHYHNGTIRKMPYIEEESFDAIVSNYVLMDCSDFEGAISEFWRVLKPGGIAVIVVSHPCFDTSPGGWVRIPPDTKRREERVGRMVDWYFKRGSFTISWADIDPPLYGFHRTLSDYLHVFKNNGFVLTDIEEPCITEQGRRELPVHIVRDQFRIPWSIIFRLNKPRVHKK
jgi:SAM-dependent methyltransferase